jgi:hypothetical protein
VVPDSVKSLLEDDNPRVALSALLLARTVSDGMVRDAYDKLIARRFPSIVETVRSIPHPLMLLFASKNSPSVVEPAPAPEAVPVRSDSEASTAVQYFQVGAYRNGINAEAVVSRLKAAGMHAYTKHNPQKELFVVYVSAGSDPGKTVLTLKDAGFEAWPLEAAP